MINLIRTVLIGILISFSSITQANATMVYEGTGFFINSFGYLVTAAHVVKGYKELYIIYKGKQIPAKLISIDEDDDSAILQVPVSNDFSFALHTVTKDKGIVFVLGYPMIDTFGFSLKVSSGVINTPATLLETDNDVFALTCPGSSGGPVIDNTGAVVGILVAGYPDPMHGPCSTHSVARPLDGVVNQAIMNGVPITLDTITGLSNIGLEINNVIKDDGVVLVINVPKESIGK